MQLLTLLLFAAAGVSAQSGAHVPLQGFLPAVGYDRVGGQSIDVAWDLGAVLGGERLQSADGSLTLLHPPLAGMALLTQGMALSADGGRMVTLGVNPNPVQQYAEVSWEGVSPEVSLRVVVYNALGQCVCDAAASGASRLTLDCTEFPNGVYVVRLLTPDGQSVGHTKVVVQR